MALLAYPREFRNAYEQEMRLVFRDLLHDPDVGRAQLAGMMLYDLANGITRPERLPSRALVLRSAIYGLILIAFAIAAEALHPGADVGFSLTPIPFIAFIPAAFWGARTTRTFAGGMWTCVVMGLVSSTMVIWNWLLFDSFPFPDLWSFALAMSIAAALCIVPAMIGATAGSVTGPDTRGSRHSRS